MTASFPRLGGLAALSMGALALGACMRLGLVADRGDGDPADADGEDADRDEAGLDEDADGDDDDDGGPSWVGWDLATFDAATRVTGQGRVEMQVAVGDSLGALEWSAWTSPDRIRALGEGPGRYLGVRARLVSPDGLSRAALGRVTVVGSGGRDQWLLGGTERVESMDDRHVEVAQGSLALASAPFPSDAALPADDFAGSGLDDRLWHDYSDARTSLAVGGGEAAIGYDLGRDSGADLRSTYDLVGDYDVRVTHLVRRWPLAAGETVIFGGLSTKVGNGTCSVERRSAGASARVALVQGGTIVGSVPDPGGAIVLRLERVGSAVHGFVRGPADPSWTDLGSCSSAVDSQVSLSWGGRDGAADMGVEMAFQGFEVLAADEIVGVDRSRPEIALEVADALAPHVVAEPESGVFEDAVVVALTAGPPGGEILYALDGTDPVSSPSRQSYDGPLRLTSSALLLARSVTEEGVLGPRLAHRYFVGERIAHAPLDDSGTAVEETVNGWSGTSESVEWGVAGVLGTAGRFDGSLSFAVLPDSTEHGSDRYQVDSGALSIWLRPDRLAGVSAVLSKDSMDRDTGGHLTLSIVEQELVLRLQSTVGDNYVRTTAAPLRAGVWQRVTVAFGPLGLCLLLSDETGLLLGAWRDLYQGGLGPGVGDVGNQEPLLLGATSALSDDLWYTPMREHFVGDLDDFSLYETW